MHIDVRGDIKAIQKDLGRLQRRDVPRATAAALNRAQDQIITQTKRGIARATKLPPKVVAGRLKKRRKASAKHNYLATEFEVRTQPVHAAKLKPRQLKRGGVRAGRFVFPEAFVVARYARRARGFVLKRDGKAATPTTSMQIPIQPHGTQIATKVTQRRGRALFQKAFTQQVRRYLKRRR
jgi:hypothetical protein